MKALSLCNSPQVVDTNSNTKWQTVQIQISWLLQKPSDLDLHCLQRQDISGLRAGHGLRFLQADCEDSFEGLVGCPSDEMGGCRFCPTRSGNFQGD